MDAFKWGQKGVKGGINGVKRGRVRLAKSFPFLLQRGLTPQDPIAQSRPTPKTKTRTRSWNKLYRKGGGVGG
eukprot:1365008-Rhodomonas_salina.1